MLGFGVFVGRQSAESSLIRVAHRIALGTTRAMLLEQDR